MNIKASGFTMKTINELCPRTQDTVTYTTTEETSPKVQFTRKSAFNAEYLHLHRTSFVNFSKYSIQDPTAEALLNAVTCRKIDFLQMSVNFSFNFYDVK